MKPTFRHFVCLVTIGVMATACGRKESADAPPHSAAIQTDAEETPVAPPSTRQPALADTPTEQPEPAAVPTEKTAAAGVACNRDLDEAACLKIGGDFGPHGKTQMQFCICPTSDSGKVCTDNSACEGYCECNAPEDTEGRCSARVTRFGCVCKMRGGRPLRICKD